MSGWVRSARGGAQLPLLPVLRQPTRQPADHGRHEPAAGAPMDMRRIWPVGRRRVTAARYRPRFITPLLHAAGGRFRVEVKNTVGSSAFKTFSCSLVAQIPTPTRPAAHQPPRTRHEAAPDQAPFASLAFADGRLRFAEPIRQLNLGDAFFLSQIPQQLVQDLVITRED